MTQGHADHTGHGPDAHHGPDPQEGPGYETRDANVNALLQFGVGLIIALVVIQFAMLAMFRLFEMERPQARTQRAQENLYQQLRDLRHGEDEALSSYKIDPRTGLARIPIERAMELVAEKGAPFGKGPKTELEMISHGGTPVPAAGKDAPKPSGETKTGNPPASTGSKP
jgi:hypothetical protein